MVYGPQDRFALSQALDKYNELTIGSTPVLCHTFPQATSAGLMISQIMEMIQNVESSVGKDFLEVFVVMPEEDACAPWSVNFGPASWVLTYKKDHDYKLFALHGDGLYDWYEPGGRWSSYLKAKDPSTQDAHVTPITAAEAKQTVFGKIYGQILVGEWSALAIRDVDWEAIAKEFPDRETGAMQMRTDLAAKGVKVPTFVEYFHEMYPALRDQVAPDAINGYLLARKWDVYWKFSEFLKELRVTHGYPRDMVFAFDEHRFSNALLERLAPLRVKTLSAWVVGGELYDLDDFTVTEERIHKGLDAIEALHEDTIVSVVDIHY
jgi:hypothetical protein